MSEIHDRSPEPTADDELFVDFANTLRAGDVPEERCPEPEALRDWLVARGLADQDTPIARLASEMPAFRDLGALVNDVTARLVAGRRPSARQVRDLNRVLRAGLHYHRLEPVGGGTAFSVSQVGDRLDQARASIAGSLAHYVAEHDVDRLRICAADDCRWRFVDRSPAGRRRWCDMRICGNRAKVARHRQRQRAMPSG